jgi:hypothetical protein
MRLFRSKLTNENQIASRSRVKFGERVEYYAPGMSCSFWDELLRSIKASGRVEKPSFYSQFNL